MPTAWPASLIAVAADAESSAERRQLARLDLAVAPVLRVPQHGAELEHLGVHAGRIVHGRLGPSDHLAPAVDAGGEAVVAAERGQLAGHAVLPDEAAADEVGGLEQEAAQLAAPVLVQRVRLAGLGDADDRARVVEPGPRHGAAGPAERADRDERPSFQSAARRVPSGWLDQPATQPWALMAMPRLCVPPSDGSLATVYCGAAAWAAPGAAA